MRNYLFLFFIILLFIAADCIAVPNAGTIEKTTGKVYTAPVSSPRMLKVKETPHPLDFETRVQTKRDSSASLDLVSGDKVVLEERSTLILSSRDEWITEEGTALFDIKKMGQARGVRVSAAAVTIGIKGTRFAIDRNGEKLAVYLKEGELSLSPSAPEEMFRLHGELQKNYQDTVKNMEENFAQMQQEMARDHAMKSEQMKATFEENREKMGQAKLDQVKEFNLQAGMAVLIDGYDLSNLVLTPEWEEKFKQLDAF